MIFWTILPALNKKFLFRRTVKHGKCILYSQYKPQVAEGNKAQFKCLNQRQLKQFKLHLQQVSRNLFTTLTYTLVCSADPRTDKNGR